MAARLAQGGADDRARRQPQPTVYHQDRGVTTLQIGGARPSWPAARLPGRCRLPAERHRGRRLRRSAGPDRRPMAAPPARRGRPCPQPGPHLELHRAVHRRRAWRGSWLPDTAADRRHGPGRLGRALQRRPGSFDRDGGLAAAGRVDAVLLDELLADPLFRQPPPRSFGRGSPAPPYVDRLLARAAPVSDQDWTETCSPPQPSFPPVP